MRKYNIKKSPSKENILQRMAWTTGFGALENLPDIYQDVVCWWPWQRGSARK